MGRLYWKFFIFFFLAQLTAGLGVGLAVWIANQKLENINAQIEASPPAKSLVDAAAVTLKFGGVQGLQGLMKHWSQRPMPQVYAVNEQDVELQGRTLPAAVVKSAREILTRELFDGETSKNDGIKSDDSSSTLKTPVQDGINLPVQNAPSVNPSNSNSMPRSSVQQVEADDGHRYLLFVPALKHQQALHSLPPSQQPSLLGFNPKPKARHLFPILPILAGVLASFIFAALLAWYFSKPIKQLRQAFASAANGNLDVRVGQEMGSRRDELADLGKAFDLMASRLGALMQSQTRLLHQVSHELRSPLARMQIAVGLARQQPDKLESSLMRIERESERMDSLVGELLELSRLESGVMKIEKEPVDLNELLLTVVEDARFEGLAKNITINYDALQLEATPVVLSAQQDLLHRAIDNVVRNALKYSPNGSRVSIATLIESLNTNHFAVDKSVTITVTDNGPGAADDELETIFQPFFRGSNTHSADGHGVGLAIAKQVIDAHGGAITAINHKVGGLVILIKLPL